MYRKNPTSQEKFECELTHGVTLPLAHVGEHVLCHRPCQIQQ